MRFFDKVEWVAMGLITLALFVLCMMFMMGCTVYHRVMVEFVDNEPNTWVDVGTSGWLPEAVRIDSRIQSNVVVEIQTDESFEAD